MSNQIPVEVYESVAKMCQQNLLKAITEGDTEQMAKSLFRAYLKANSFKVVK